MDFKNAGYVECAYSIYLIYLRNVNVFSIAFFRNKVFFLNMIFKNKGTKTFLTPIVCKMYKKVCTC